MYPHEFFYRSVRRNPGSRAVIHPGGTLTYAALCRAVQAVAAAIRAADPEPGTRVGLLAGNHLEHLVAFLGIHASSKTWVRSEEHTSELQSLMRISYAVFCLQKKSNYNS